MNKNEQPVAKIEISKNGPYIVSGNLPLSEQRIVVNAEGESLEYKEGKEYPSKSPYALCRCGHSANKPYCDGTHAKVRFDGTETADREAYLAQAKTVTGPTMLLTDVENLCAFARFCDPKGSVWNLVQQADDPETRKLVEHEAGHCPSGRLVVWDRETGKAIEPKFEPSLGLIEDTAKEVSGPIWVRGGVPVISADGSTYEIRNRVTLCRCGRSTNKPFCDGAHAG
ncbi:MAG TPA: CDGSH iron-sulfur domain-containing protein [Verrucomicrobiae bacterium]|jgi:CDGSH-type Zn-finger protein|nr:CDGSH iron-sulfur domain-containing protein [Verrucomicrobiae bacterium]